MPNPSDQSFEILKNYEQNCINDVFFAMSHGVHRGDLKKGKSDNREIFINKLLRDNQNIKFDIYGMNNVQPVWGDNFIQAISNSSMGINLSRGQPVKYYSSDRIAQLLGNGLLTFVDQKTQLGDFLTNDQIIFYKNLDDLSYKLNKYKKDKKEAKRIAKNGKTAYLKNFNSTIISDFILSKLLIIKVKINLFGKNKLVVNKYLIFRTDRIGDFLITAILIKSIKRNDPNSYVQIISSKKNYTYIKSFKMVDEVILLNKGLINKLKLIKKLKKSFYKTIIVHDSKKRSKIISFFLNKDLLIIPNINQSLSYLDDIKKILKVK